MKKSGLLKVFWVLVTSVVLICIPESSFAAGGHGGGGGGFHGAGGGGGFHGGGFGGGFHGGGFGGYHGGWGGAGWHGGWGGYGWRGGWGYPGWGRGWGWGYPGWGWGVGIGFGWGWGSYWPSYPYAYGYPYYAYPNYPSYPYYGPDSYAPPDPDRYNGGNGNPRDNSQHQNSNYPAPERSTGVNDKIPATTFASHRTAGDSGSAKYWLANYQQHMVPRQAVRNVIQALLAMPPEARRRQIESGRYRNFSPEEQEFLNEVAQGVGGVGEPQKNAETKPEGLRLASQ